MNGLIDVLIWVFLIACVLFMMSVVILCICLVIADIREDRNTVICDELKKVEEAFSAEFGEYIPLEQIDQAKLRGRFTKNEDKE